MNERTRHVLELLGFPPVIPVERRRSIAVLFPLKRRRTGVYLLVFSDGACYIGQAVNVVRRFSQHRRSYDDRIVGFSFQHCARRDLDGLERTLIQEAELKGVPLAQTTWKTEVYGEADVDDVLTDADVESWCRDPAAFFGASAWDPAPVDPGRHALDARRLSALQSEPLGHDVIRFLSRYVRECVPGARQTAHDFWNITAMPSTNAGTWPRLACLSAHVMEILVLGKLKHDFSSGWGFMVCSRSVVKSAYGSLPKASRALGADYIELSEYASAGSDQCRIGFSSLRAAHTILDHAPIRMASAQLIYRVMRKGVTRYANVHCTALADLLLRGDWMSGARPSH
ncbi:MAG: GIY-YIG nuclease family protein [Gemmatimonadaceae bacterium]|jgi:hypothetical protein|nr:GIY-YIG nuclease family protein [Gemmatimonadaceae bacterium]